MDFPHLSLAFTASLFAMEVSGSPASALDLEDDCLTTFGSNIALVREIQMVKTPRTETTFIDGLLVGSGGPEALFIGVKFRFYHNWQLGNEISLSFRNQAKN